MSTHPDPAPPDALAWRDPATPPECPAGSYVPVQIQHRYGSRPITGYPAYYLRDRPAFSEPSEPIPFTGFASSAGCLGPTPIAFIAYEDFEVVGWRPREDCAHDDDDGDDDDADAWDDDVAYAWDDDDDGEEEEPNDG